LAPIRVQSKYIVNQTQSLFSQVYSTYSDFKLTNNMVADLKFHNGSKIEIIVSKAGGKYRFQTMDISTLLITMEYFTNFMEKFFKNEKDKLEFSTADNLPVQELLKFIDIHFDKRIQLEKLMENLSRLSAQYRAAEKKLLLRFKVRQ
jgi:hypothetical protein